jgi:hypothetical protein
MPNLFNNEYANLASKGRFGDTMLAHINPQEAGLLTAMGGAGTINPQTGLREFYTDMRGGNPTTYQAPSGYVDMRGGSPSRPAPFDMKFADVSYAGRGTPIISGYTLPTEKTFADKPLVAQYDKQGNFKHFTMQGDNYIVPDPSKPNIISQPRLDANGQVIDYGVIDLNKQEGDGIGSVISDIASNLGPIALAALAGYAFNPAAGNILGLGGGGAAATAPVLGGGGAAATGVTNGLLGSALPAGAGAGGTFGVTAAGAATLPNVVNATNAANISTGLMGSALPSTAGSVTTAGATTAAATAAGAGAASTITPSLLQSISDATGISVDTLKTFGPSVIQGLTGAAGSVLTANQATDAATTQANAITRAAQIAADAARFRPVGVTTRFGTSNFTTDAAGNVVTAGYTPSAEITGYQDRLRTLAGQGLTDIEGARAAYSPLSSAAQNLFSLGQGYLAKTPEQAAQDYIAKQQALLAPSQENQLAELRNRQFQTGRGGVAVSQGGNLMATNPEMAAYYNSLAQSNLALAAQADQEARNRIQFGAGLFDTGANLQGRYYTGQTAAYSPFTTAIDTSSGLERLAQQPLDLSTSIGQRVSTANANVGQLTGQGIINAASTMAPANAYSAGGNLLSGAAQSPVFANAVNRAFGNTQQSTQQQYTYDPVTKQFVPVQSPFAT